MKIAFINDIHFGINDTERELGELRKNFLPFLRENPVDILFLGGDYFDHKLNLCEPSAIMAFTFFNELLEIVKEKNIKLRMIEGTKSHDRFQPQILENCIVESDKIDYKLFEFVGEENLLGLDILYVPEEYPMNINEYYKPYREKKYDLMIVHGSWDFITFGASIDENERNDINTAPVFKYSEWKDALEHGVAICGHIHGRHGFKDASGDKIIYPGSFTAWSFDQISKRGFLYGEIENQKLTYKFIDNPDAPTYANLNVEDLGLDFSQVSVNEITQAIEEQKAKVDHLKVNIDALSQEYKMILKEYYKNVNGVQVDMKPKKLLLESAENAKKYEKYNYLLKDNLTISQAILRFIKEDVDPNSTITEEKIKEILKEEK